MRTKKDIRRQSIYCTHYMDDSEVEDLLEEHGFNLQYTTWVFSWAPPAWASDSDKAKITEKLEESDYRAFLLNVHEETIVGSTI